MRLAAITAFKSRFSVKKEVSAVITLGSSDLSASGYFASVSKVFCFTTHQGS